MPFLSGILCFGLGYFIAQSKPESVLPVPESVLPVPESHQDIAVENFIQRIQQKAQTQPENSLALQQQLKNQKAQVNSVIDSATTEQVNKYLEQSFPGYDLSSIQNKHTFAKRLVSEFVDAKNDPNEVLAGKATVTTQQQYAANSVLPRQIYDGQQ